MAIKKKDPITVRNSGTGFTRTATNSKTGKKTTSSRIAKSTTRDEFNGTAKMKKRLTPSKKY